MTITVELQRAGSSRSVSTIPIVARVDQGGRYGADLLAGQRITDVEQAQRMVTDALENRFNQAVAVRWVDRTGE